MQSSFFDQLIYEITSINLDKILFIAIVFYIPFYFSKKAESLFFHLFYAFFGAYMIFTSHDPRIIYDTKTLAGFGLLIPQIPFLIQFFKDTFFTVKMMSVNTYYFFVTIYYKIIRFIHWVQSIVRNIKIFFKTFSFKKEDYTSSYDNYSKKQKSKFGGDESFYNKQKQENSYHQEQEDIRQEAPKQEYGEFTRFYDDSAYVVLGVVASDDLQTIKKAYRKLIREYHPDLNPDNIELYTEITQNINSAWEKIEKWHK